MEAPCTVISVGSCNDYTFEATVLNETKCDVVTVDCTVSDPQILDPVRHKFIKKCLTSSTAVKERADLATYEEIVSSLGLPPGSAPLLKFDAEGYEFPVFSEWDETTMRLPEQIAVELHYRSDPASALSLSQPLFFRPELDLAELALFVGHMANLGYGVVSREDNAFCDMCSELTFFRVESHYKKRAD
ncbi:hypothetical protein HYH03_004498 [Edaphochlamys debaryana]|uniref:Methyltransferase domain-containing protein n=1 Tax=Edaphochlamys debaryana TaxID=47281 RepID=A0A836C1V6_9CHLO|nr:hypothetical protein HYH03_004498 [Edaphochlamys debaryana]|eukprot:KAG2497336.1 hypothetical protein HYH03_004498 [Edaphochlamys debaryana]